MNADQAMRAHSATLPSPTFPDPAFVIPPALASATVAIVTSAALHTADDTAFAGGDTSFRLIDRDRRDLVLDGCGGDEYRGEPERADALEVVDDPRLPVVDLADHRVAVTSGDRRVPVPGEVGAREQNEDR